MKKLIFFLAFVLSQFSVFGQWIVTDYNNIDSLGTYYNSSGKVHFYFKTSITNGQAAVSYQKILASTKILNDGEIIFLKAKIIGGEVHAMITLGNNLNPIINTNIVTLIPTGQPDIYTFTITSGIAYVNIVGMRLGYFPHTFGVRNIQIDSIWTSSGIVLESGGITSVDDSNGPPDEFSLEQNYPNPFNPSTTINFSIQERSYVSLKVYDLLGREISTLVNEELVAGNHSVEFNASDLSSGTYFYHFITGNFSQTKKMNLLK